MVVSRCFGCETNIECVKKYKKCKDDCKYVYCFDCLEEVFMDDDEIMLWL